MTDGLDQREIARVLAAAQRVGAIEAMTGEVDHERLESAKTRE
jgi:hypothetical protein